MDRYEKGERFCEGKWVSVADDVRFHRQSIENGWKIQSEHYDIVTNHSHEEGVRLIRMLEDCYRAWKLLFLRYMATDPQLASLFDGRPVTTPQRRHRIYFYRNKDDFVLNLKTSSKDNTELYAGFYRYRENEGACHFYAVEEDEPEWRRRHVVRTMYHEATHQLFFETRKCSMSYGSRHNYWLVEGVAEYMESLQHEPNGYYVLGGEKKTIAWKMKNKENRLSTEQLCRINYKEFKGHLVKGESLYGQSHAMFDFLFHSEDGRWRDAVIVYLRAVYDGKDTPETLRTLTGCTFNELDAALERYLEQ